MRAVGTASLQLEVTFGDISDLIAGGTYTGVAFGGVVEVFGEEIMDVVGDFADKELSTIEKPVTAAQTDFTVDLPVGDLYRRLYIKCTRLTNDVDLVDDIINRIQVKSDGFFVHFDRISWRQIRDANKQQYSLETLPAGYAVIDFCEDGDPKGLIDTHGASSFQVIMDVTFTGGANPKIRVIPETLTASKTVNASAA